MNLDEALGYVQQGPVDLALIDINLNGKHDGIALGQHLKNQGQIPHVLLTPNSDPKTIQKAKKTAPMGITPPAEPHLLFVKIKGEHLRLFTDELRLCAVRISMRRWSWIRESSTLSV